MWSFILLFFGILIIIIVIFANSDTAKRSENSIYKNKETIESIFGEKIVNGILFISDRNYNAALINEKANTLDIVSTKSMNEYNERDYNHHEIILDHILSSEVIIDGETITSTSRGSQIGGALVGGAVLGGVGAVIGGLSGKTKSNEQVKSIDIKLTINDLEQPIYKINFLQHISDITEKPTGKSISKKDKKFQNAIKEVEKWQGMFDVILKKTQQQNS